MLSNIVLGNAADDGKYLRDWFVGDIEGWCKRDGLPYDPLRFHLQNTTALEMKWGTYARSYSRPGGWAPCSDKTTISILVRGRFTVMFRHPGDPSSQMEYQLTREGDFLIWNEDMEHFWQAEEDSAILTVRWKSG